MDALFLLGVPLGVPFFVSLGLPFLDAFFLLEVPLRVPFLDAFFLMDFVDVIGLPSTHSYITRPVRPSCSTFQAEDVQQPHIASFLPPKLKPFQLQDIDDPDQVF